MKRNKRIFANALCLLSSFTLATTTIGLFSNNFQNINFTKNDLNSTTPNAITNDSLSLKLNNRNHNNVTPYGIVQISNTKVRMVSYFNTILWEYDLNGTTSIIKQITNANSSTVANNFSVKYNSFNSNIIVYGKVTVNNTASPFVFQLNSQTGSVYYANANNTLGILSSTQLGSDEILDFYINKNDGTLFLIPKLGFQSNNNTNIKLINSISYQVNTSKFSGLGSEVINGANKSIQAVFDVNDNVWGLTVYTKNANPTKDKYQYYIFDSSLKFLCKSNENEITTTTGNNNPTESAHSEASIATPVVMPFNENGQQAYLIVDANVVPITDSTYTNKFLLGTNFFRTHKLTYNKSTNVATIAASTNSNVIVFGGLEYSILSFDLDKKNNALIYTAYGTKTVGGAKTIDFSKYIVSSFKLNTNNTSIIVSSSILTVNLDANVKSIPSFSIVNDYDVLGTNTWLVTQNATYSNTQHDAALNLTNTLPSKLDFKRGNIVTSNNASGAVSLNNSWNRLVENPYSTAADASQYKNNLPQDVPENEIMNWVTYSFDNNSSTNVDYTISKSLVQMNSETNFTLSGSNNVLFNNTNGSLKAKVKIDFNKWWNTSKKYTRYVDINLTIFNTIEKLKFILVTNNSVDSTKYNQIEQLKQTKKPSQVTVQEILNNFFVTGTNSTLNLTENSISINGVGSNTTPDYNYPIKVTTDDIAGVLSLSYDLSDVSSLSMESTNVRGRYDFTNFVKEMTSTQITLNTSKFNEIKKNKLPYEFDIEDIVSSLDVPSIYNNFNNWELTYTDAIDSEAYYNNLISGTTSFTIKYRRDNNIPSTIPDTDLSVTVDSTSNGTGCKKLSAVTGNQITFDTDNALSLTGDMTINEINDNLNTLLRKTINIQNEWFNATEIKLTMDQNTLTENSVTYNVGFEGNQINSNIRLYNAATKSSYFLVVNKSLMDKLKADSATANLFDLKTISFQYNLVKYNWNFGINQENAIPQTSYEQVLQSINNDRLSNNLKEIEYEFLLPTQFAEKYNNNWEEFNSLYPLISPTSKTYTNAFLKSSSSNPNYFEIQNIDFIGNDSLGTVNVRYTLFYKNLGTNGLKSNAEIVLTNFKTLQSNSTNYLALIISISIVAALIIFIVPAILTFKRGKYLSNKNDSKSKNSTLSKQLQKITKKQKDVTPIETNKMKMIDHQSLSNVENQHDNRVDVNDSQIQRPNTPIKISSNLPNRPIRITHNKNNSFKKDDPRNK